MRFELSSDIVSYSHLTVYLLHSSLEGSVIQVSEQGSRKNLYQRIVLQFPEGWMNSGQISREGVYIAYPTWFPDR